MRNLFSTAIAILLLSGGVAWAGGSTAPPPTTAIPNGVSGNVWGDSLAAGDEDQSGITLETALTIDLGIPFTNNGIGTQKSTQISMRQGGVPIQLTFSGNQIVYYNQAITAVEGASVLGMSTTQDPDYRFLSNTSSTSSQIVYGSVCGVHGVMTVIATGGPPSTAQTYYFGPDGQYPTTNVLSAAPQSCAALSVFTPDLASAQRIQPAIFWEGNNNTGQPAQIQSDLAGSIAYLGHSNYLCLTTTNSEGQPSGSAGYNAVVAANAAIATTCTSPHTFDIREFAVEQYNAANPVDVEDHANDIPAYTQRAVIMRGTTTAISTTSTCSFTLTPTFGASSVGVMKVDSEYILISTIAGNVVSGCTRGYGTGGIAATHTNGAAVMITDNLHYSGALDALAAAYIAANYKSVLLGSTPTTIPNNTGVGGVIAVPNAWSASQFFQLPTFLGMGEVWQGSMCIQQAVNPYTQSLTGSLTNVLCSLGGTGTITLGGAQNTQICFTIGGTSGCTVGLTSKGLMFSNIGFSDIGYAATTPTTGNTVIIADTADTAILTPAGTLSALTLQLPTCSASFDGKVAHVTTTHIITTLTTTATAGSVSAGAAPSTLTAGGHAAFICQGSGATWYGY